MQELSLNILDIAQNSVVACATLIEITLDATKQNQLMVTIQDNGKGMSAELLAQVTNPFCTARTTRKVGLGVPFFKQAAEMTGGSFEITSTPKQGTKVVACFDITHIDYTPLGAIWDTIAVLIQANPQIDFVYTVLNTQQNFVCDTRQLKEMMDGISLSELTVVQFIKDYIKENHLEILKRSY